MPAFRIVEKCRGTVEAGTGFGLKTAAYVGGRRSTRKPEWFGKVGLTAHKLGTHEALVYNMSRAPSILDEAQRDHDEAEAAPIDS